MASHLAIGDLHEQWDFAFAAIIPEWAPGMESATAWRLDWFGRLALDWAAHTTAYRL